MAFLTIFTIIVGVLIFIGFLIWEVSKNKNLQKYPVVANAPIILNFPKRRFSGGYRILTEKRVRENKNGTYLIEGFPFDQQQGENVKKAPMQSFIVLKGNLKVLSGDGERIIKLVTSSDPTDYPEEMRDTQEQKFMSHEGLKADLVNIFKEGFIERDKIGAELMQLWAGGEMSSNTLGKIKEEVDKIKKIADAEEEKQKEENKK